MKLFRLSALVAALSLAACTSSSPGPALSDPAAPSFDGSTSGGGGNGLGGGNFEGVSSDTTGTGDGGTERGGAGMGSGN